MPSSTQRAAGPSSTANRTKRGSSSKPFRSIDSDSAPASVVKHQPWPLICLVSGFVISVAIMMFFGAVSVMSTPPHGPPPPAPTRGQRGGTVTWWDIGPASAKAAAANASIRDVLPMLRTENWEPPGEPFGEWHPLKRGNVYQAGLLATTDSVSTEGNKEFASGAASPALAAEKDQVDSRSPRMTKTPTPRGRRGSLEGLTPVHYVLEIQPSLEEAANFTFNGTVTITFACRTRTDKVAVHAAAGLAVDVLSIAAAFRSAQKPLRVENASRSALQDLYLVRLREQLHRNVRYNLTLRFAGTVGTEPKGLYRVSYADAHSKGLRYRWRWWPASAYARLPDESKLVFCANTLSKLINGKNSVA